MLLHIEVLGCELVTDVEVWPGARVIEVVPPGPSVSLVLLPPDSEIPVAIRLGTSDPQHAQDKVREAGVTLPNDELIRTDGYRRCSPSPTPTATAWSTWRKPSRADPADHRTAPPTEDPDHD